MKILVTGGTGLVGKAFLKHQRALDNEILHPERDTLDLLNYENVLSYLDYYRPEAVVHCAGLVGGIQKNIDAPAEFLNQNLQMGFNVVNACQEAGVLRLLNLGSSCMYPKDRDWETTASGR